jgi:hypothetical protein
VDDQPDLAGPGRHERCGTPIIHRSRDGARAAPVWDHAETPALLRAHRVGPRPGSVAPADVWDCDEARAGLLGTQDSTVDTR